LNRQARHDRQEDQQNAEDKCRTKFFNVLLSDLIICLGFLGGLGVLAVNLGLYECQV
jgi:hypothetical protein